MTDDKKFMIYALAWGLLAVTFTVLRKREKSIKRRKAITLIGSLLILVLIFGFALWAGFPWKPLSLFALLAIGMVYIGQKYTCYCESCGHSQQSSFQKMRSVLNAGRNTNWPSPTRKRICVSPEHSPCSKQNSLDFNRKRSAA